MYENYKIIELQDSDAKAKEEVLGQIAAELEFPDYFGMNLDAFNDCLSEVQTPVCFRIAREGSAFQVGWVKAIYEIAADISEWNDKVRVEIADGTDDAADSADAAAAKALLVYYSLEGNTDYAAKRIAERIGADTLRLKPVKEYRSKGFAKFFWGGKSAMMGERPALESYSVDWDAYDRVVFGFPVWAANVTPPLRTFVEENKEEIAKRAVSVFACQSGSGADKALEKLLQAIGIARFENEAVFIDPKDAQSEGTDDAIDAFGDALK